MVFVHGCSCQNLRRFRDFARKRWPFGPHKIAVCYAPPTAAPWIPRVNLPMAFALWSRPETRYSAFTIDVAAQHLFRQTRAPFSPHSDEDLRWRPGAPQACHFASVITNKLSKVDPQAASGLARSGADLKVAGRHLHRRLRQAKCPNTTGSNMEGYQ